MKKTVVITGATSGLGFALAVAYLKKGDSVAITGRTLSKVKEANDKLKQYNNFITAEMVDVTNEDAMFNFIKHIDSTHKLDVFIANAGVSAGVMGSDNKNFDLSSFHTTAKEIFNINVMGVFNGIHPAIDCMKNKGGNIVIISSMSAFFGLKSALFYASSKAAIKSYGEGLRVFLSDYNINVTTVFPGFIESNITKANKFKMPFFMSAEKAANIIVNGVSKNKGYIMFPKIMYFITYIVSILPFFVREKILKKLPNK